MLHRLQEIKSIKPFSKKNARKLFAILSFIGFFFLGAKLGKNDTNLSKVYEKNKIKFAQCKDCQFNQAHGINKKVIIYGEDSLPLPLTRVTVLVEGPKGRLHEINEYVSENDGSFLLNDSLPFKTNKIIVKYSHKNKEYFREVILK